MEEILKPTHRRTVLVRGFAALAGAFGLAVVDKKALAQEPVTAASNCGNTLRLYGRRWQVHTAGRPPGESGGHGHRLIHQGELLDRPDGDKVGEFCSTCFCLESSFCLNPLADSNLEFQTFKMKDGTLFGMTAGGHGAEDGKMHAIVGGTGRFAGARGSYVTVQNAQTRKSGLIEIVVTIST